MHIWNRVEVHALLGITGVAALFVTCVELYNVDDEHVVPARIAPSECTVDEDCVLVPALLTCCGECEPVPPFDAVTYRALERLLDATDQECAPRSRLCDPPICRPLPVGCEARAVCREGRCRAVANAACLYR